MCTTKKPCEHDACADLRKELNQTVAQRDFSLDAYTSEILKAIGLSIYDTVVESLTRHCEGRDHEEKVHNAQSVIADTLLDVSKTLAGKLQQAQLPEDFCVLAYVTTSSVNRLRNATRGTPVRYSIIEIEARPQSTWLKVPTLGWLTGGEKLRVVGTKTRPTINAPKDHYYVRFGSRIKNVAGHFWQNDSRSVEVDKQVADTGPAETGYVSVRRRLTLSLDVMTDGNPESVASVADSPQSELDTPATIGWVERLLDYYLPVSDENLECLTAYMSTDGTKERKNRAADSVEMDRDVFDEHLTRAQHHEVLRLIMQPDPNRKEICEALGVSSIESKDDDGKRKGLLPAARAAFQAAFRSKPRPEWLPLESYELMFDNEPTS